jgi:hypothetical protein
MAQAWRGGGETDMVVLYAMYLFRHEVIGSVYPYSFVKLLLGLPSTVDEIRRQVILNVDVVYS